MGFPGSIDAFLLEPLVEESEAGQDRPKTDERYLVTARELLDTGGHRDLVVQVGSGFKG